MHKEWENIYKTLSEDSDHAHIITMRVWSVIGLVALVGFIVLAVVEGV